MKTIILRRSATRIRDINSSLERMTAPAPVGRLPGWEAPISGLEVLVDDLTEKDRHDLEQRSEFLTADPIPLSLIAPIGGKAAASTSHFDTPSNAAAGQPTWGVKAVGADVSPFTGKGVSVAILDTGIDESHPAFSDPSLRIVKRNFTNQSNDDTDGHGTHCAGTIFGRDVNGKRIGVAPGVTTAFIGKVLPGGTDTLVEAINWAFQNKAMVLSMSLGFDFPRLIEHLEHQQGLPESAAISYGLRAFRANIAIFDALMNLNEAQALDGAGTVVIAAAGNESRSNGNPPYTIASSPPASSLGIIAVGALQKSAGGLRVASFSNTHPQIAAPGVDVVSAEAGAGGLTALSGTSMACPHAAGLAALYWEAALAAGTLPSAGAIAAKLIGRAQTKDLAPGWAPISVGDGVPTAP